MRKIKRWFLNHNIGNGYLQKYYLRNGMGYDQYWKTLLKKEVPIMRKIIFNVLHQIFL